MKFERLDREVAAIVQLSADYESFPGAIHGGIVATILDESMARAVLEETRVPSVTIGMRVRYAQIMKPGERYHVTARITSVAGGVLHAEARLADAADNLTASASGTFLSMTADRVRHVESGLPSVMVDGIKNFMENSKESS
jgi:acyl-coenzyme A thioesterase PaaI-like protein